MKKPKPKKLPRKPKNSASLETWERYDQRCAEIKKENEERLRDWKKRKEKKEKLIRKHR